MENDPNMALISAMTELCGQNDEIRGAPQMKQLISLLASDETGGALDETGQDLVATSLKATEDAALLDAFVRSEAALKRLVKWLEASMSGERADQTRVLLSLFAHLPMTVEALMASKAGHVVNNARKVENEAVKKAAVELVKAWKAMSSGKPAAPKPPPVAKRPAAPAPAPDAKRVRPEAAEDEDFGLDSALSGAGAPRKASLKPDHLRARRPVQQLPSTLPSRSRPPPAPAPAAAPPRAEPAAPPRPAAAPVAAPAAAAPAPPPPQPAAEPPASSVVARKPPSSKRVSWRGTEELVETREYIVEAKKAATTSWGDLLQAERERERLAMQQRLSADNDPWAIGGGDDEPAEAAPQTQTSAPAPSSAPPPRASAPAEPPAAAVAAAAPASQPEPVPALVAWRTPPMLEDTFWPKAKGDDSSERDAQAARRKSRPEVSFRRMQDVVGMPAEPPPESAPPREPVEIPFEKAATPDPPPAAAPAPLLTPAPHPPAGVGGGAPGGVGGVNIVGAGAQAMLLQQQQQLQQQRQQQQAAAAMQPFGGVGFGMMSGPQNGFGGGGGGGGRGGGGGGGGGLTERLMGSFMQQQQANTRVPAGRGLGFPQGAGGPGGSRYRTRPCRYFANGGCKNGDQCTFLHDPSNLGTPADWGAPFRPPFMSGGKGFR